MEDVKQEKQLSIPEYFMLGAKKGFYITVEVIAPAMVMAYVIITFFAAFRPDAAHRAAARTGDGPLRPARRGLGGAAGRFLCQSGGRGHGGVLYAAGVLTAEEATILFPACITMGTLVGHFARIVLVCKVRPVYYPIMLATPLIDAAIVMVLTRLVLALYR